jgi:hypothetical protein
VQRMIIFVIFFTNENSYCVSDVDECDLMIHDCEQECIDTAGGFECSSFNGYTYSEADGCTQSKI